MKRFIDKYEIILNWIPIIGILFFIRTLNKYSTIRMYVEELMFWVLYQTCVIAVLIQMIKDNVN